MSCINTMKKSLKKEFRISNFFLRHGRPKCFVRSQWQLDKENSSFFYLFIRLAIFTTFLVIWILTITMETAAGRPRWPIYLTNWGLTLCLLQSFFSVLMLTSDISVTYLHGNIFWANTILKLFSTYWLFNVMATTVAFTITLVYWTLVFQAEGGYWSTINFMVHGFNSILMLFDLWIVSHPVRILHCIYPMILGIIYVIFSAIFYIAGGTTKNGSRSIYPILNWDQDNIKSTVLYCVVIIIVMVVIHIVTFLMYKIRWFIYKKFQCYRTQSF